MIALVSEKLDLQRRIDLVMSAALLAHGYDVIDAGLEAEVLVGNAHSRGRREFDDEVEITALQVEPT